MKNWLLRWVASGIALAIVAHLNIGVSYQGAGALVAATLFIGLVNSLVRPVLNLLTKPLNCMTLGLFGIFLNALLFYLTGVFVPGFKVELPWGPLLGPILMGFISGLLNHLLEDKKKD